jgi:hypothetical protein
MCDAFSGVSFFQIEIGGGSVFGRKVCCLSECCDQLMTDGYFIADRSEYQMVPYVGADHRNLNY